MKKVFKWILILLIIGAVFACFMADDNEEMEVTSAKLSKKMESANLTKAKQVKVNSKSTDVTILVYMNGSNLESDDGEATTDLTEMINASNNSNINVVVQTMGTKSWRPDLGIASSKSQRYSIENNELKLIDDNLSQLDCTKSETLSDFIKWGKSNFPADRYILLFWNHGSGPVYGYGFDEYLGAEESLTIDEIQLALKESDTYFDFIGMDCCLMSSLELCCAIYDYADYAILSEDFESGYGWEYTTWLSELAKNPSISTPDLAKIIIDNTVKVNEEEIDGSSTTLALIDLSYLKPLYIAWVDFAYKNENALLGKNYSQHVRSSNRGIIKQKQRGLFSDWLSLLSEDDENEYTMDDYYVTDIMSVASNINSEESKVLQSALSTVLTYYNSTKNEKSLTGISVTLPYGDSEFYDELKKVFSNCGFDQEYIEWLSKFTVSNYDNDDSFYDYDAWADEWDGWNDYDYYYDDEDWFDWFDSHDWDDEDYDYDWDEWDYEEDYNDDYYYDDTEIFDWFLDLF